VGRFHLIAETGQAMGNFIDVVFVPAVLYVYFAATLDATKQFREPTYQFRMLFPEFLTFPGDIRLDTVYHL
jgi:hypothetical protein